jgi:vacuolar-type H+-ATPase subunit C/Vma6
MLLRLLRYPYANTRSRFLSAGFLKPARVEQLASQPSREQAAAFLEPFFSLPAASWPGVEWRIRADYQVLGRKVARALPSGGRRLVEAWLRRAETENLKIACRALLLGQNVEAVQYLFIPTVSVGGITDEKLRQVHTLDELVGALRQRQLAGAIRQGLAAAEDQRLLSIELALDRAAWEAVRERLSELGWADRAAAAELLELRADLDRFNVVHRGWRAGLRESELLEALPPLGTAYPARDLRRALRSEDPEAGLNRLFPLSGFHAPLSIAGEVALARRLFRRLVETMRSHPFDLAIPLATVLLKELECRDVQAILSGLRLGRRQEEIMALLACAGEE